MVHGVCVYQDKNGGAEAGDATMPKYVATKQTTDA